MHVYAFSDRQHLPGDCGLGEITANLVGEDFEVITTSLSFCKSFPEAATEIARVLLITSRFVYVCNLIR